jgi:multicomponent Na+:H+ antiporter subunit E
MSGVGARVRQAGRLLVFSGYFTRELVVANAQVVWDVLTPRSRLAPGVAAVPLRSRTDLEVTLISNLVTLTPGTLSLAVQRDPPVLYVHGMYAEDVEEFRRSLAEMEARMLGAVRVGGLPAPHAEPGAAPGRKP